VKSRRPTHQLVGDFKNAGRELRPRGQPEPVRVHDFKIPELGKVAPYGVYDIAANHGWVSVGIDADTAAFAVESIRRWWQKLGQARYPDATCLTITADCGGSNGARVKLWKRELQRFANETDLSITVTHLPPGTSKWNKIEHRLFAFITQNWRAKPLLSHAAIIQLIGATTTETGLQVCCEIDGNLYPKGVQLPNTRCRRSTRRAMTSTENGIHHCSKPTTTVTRLFIGRPLGAPSTA
jgi:hypothetical protein